MQTVDDHAPDSPRWRDRALRDLRLLLRMTRMMLSYLVTGGRVRRLVRRAEASGETYWVDRHGPRPRG